MKKALLFVGSLLLISMMPGYAAKTTATDMATPAADPVTASTPVVSQPSFAVVNVQQLFQTSPKIADLNKQLQAKFKARQDKLIAAQKSVQDEMDKLKKESPTMSLKDKETLQLKINSDQQDLQKTAAAFQADLNKEQNKVMKGVLAQLNDVISAIARKNGFSFVLDAQAVIYATPDSDITKQVSREFDTK